MNSEQKQEANIAAATLLGYEFIKHDGLASGAVSIKVHGNTTRLFNLFNNPTDCLAVVKKFPMYMIYITPSRYNTWSFQDVAGEGLEWDTYEEAVADACLVIASGEYEV